MTKSKYISTDKKTGVTLVELMLAIAVLGIILPLITMFFSRIVNRFGIYEMTTQLRKANQQSMNRIHLRIGSCKRLFENSSNDMAFLARVDLSGCPSVLTGSKLPLIEETGSLVVNTTSFINASVGNSIFFATTDMTSTLSDVYDSTDALNTVKIDVYRFYYYYLTPDNSRSVDGRSTYKIVEWKSIKYADYNQLNDISDATLRQNTAAALYNDGIFYAMNISQINVSNAFYQITNAGIIIIQPSHSITLDEFTTLTDIMTGIMGSGYIYGISSNTTGWTRAPKTVPLYANAGGLFPGGFEVAIVGQSGGRKVFLRSVLVSQYGTQYIIGDEASHISSVRDLW